MEKEYELKKIYRWLAIFGAICLAMIPTKGAAFAIVVPLALYALSKKRLDLLFFWIVLIAVSPYVNGYFMPKNIVHGISFRASMVLIGLFGTFLLLSSRLSKFLAPLLGLFVYLLYMTIPSAVGWAPMISFLKIWLFVSFFMAVMYMGNAAINSDRYRMKDFRNVILAFAIFFVFGSILVYPFPAISSMNAQELVEKGVVVTSLYKGVTNHSQTMGMVAAFWTVFIYADFIFHIRRTDKLYLALLLGAIFLVYKSSSRTAMGTVLCGVMVSSWWLMQMKGIGSRWRSKVISGLAVFGVVAMIGVLLSPGLRQSVVKFVLKYADESSGELALDSESVFKTRQFLVDQQMYNYHRRPTIGWGFQVSEEVGEMAKQSGGFVLSAPVEKGVWVTAILEEGGICGEVIYWAYFLTALVMLMMRKAYFGFTMFMAVHVSNLGEFTMFSMSGVGGLWYAFIFIALAFDAKRTRQLEMARGQWR